MTVTYVGAGTQASGTSAGTRTLTPALPALSAVGDLMFLIVQSGRAASSTGPAMTDPAGWERLKMHYMESGVGPKIQQGIWWRVKESGDTAPSVTFPSPLVYFSAQVVAYTSSTTAWAICSNVTFAASGSVVGPYTPVSPTLTATGCVFSFLNTSAPTIRTPDLTGSEASANGFTRNIASTLPVFNYSGNALATRDLVPAGLAPVPTWQTNNGGAFDSLLATTVAFTSAPDTPPSTGGWRLGLSFGNNNGGFHRA